MKNVYVNDAETVFEPFWDSGDSYPNHEKYSYLDNYLVTVANEGTEKAEPIWNGIKVTVCQNDDYSVIMKRKIKLGIEDFDRFIFAASVPENIKFLIRCNVDGKMTDIISDCGGKKEYEGEIYGKEITEIEISFKNISDNPESALLSWLGLANSKRREEMLKRKSVYDSNWEGCFCKDYEFEPAFDLFIKKEEIESIRNKVLKKPFSLMMDRLRKFAESVSDTEPEKLIGKYVDFHEPRFARERDIDEKRMPVWKVMENLAFVGLIDKNEKYLKLACRYALSVSCCENWHESFVGNLPGTTWHHRSFKEGMISAACAKVLSYAGNLLTWHGKNIIYNAIIMKGIPRLEADIRTMDYIWHMNQGLVFSTVYIISLTILEKKYPRYKSLIEEAEKNINEMWDNYIMPDGGACEGAGYWNYSAEYYLMAMYILSVRNNVPFEEFCKERIEKSSLYAEAMLSTAKSGISMLPFNDTKTDKSFDLINLAFFVRTGDDFWKNVFSKTVENFDNITLSAEAIIIAPEFTYNENKESDKLISLKNTGYICAKRNNKKIVLVSGPVLFGHSHEDKGSFVLEADGEALLIDRGVCEYSNAQMLKFSKASWHNLLIPIKNGTEASQKNREGFGGEIIYEYENNGFVIMGTDVSKAWDEYEKCIRFIISPDSECYLIYDIVEYNDKAMKSAFTMNTYGDVKADKEKIIITGENNMLEVVPLNYRAECIDFRQEGCDGSGKPVNKISIKTSEKRLITAINFAEEKVQIFNDTVIYKDNKIEIKENTIIINNKKFNIF